MPVEASITLLTSLVSIGVVILLAGIPWAYTIHGRLTTIETSLSQHLRLTERVDSLVDRLTRLELAVRRDESSS
jgi:hypothetical protein